jgi:hypothetical protein
MFHIFVFVNKNFIFMNSWTQLKTLPGHIFNVVFYSRENGIWRFSRVKTVLSELCEDSTEQLNVYNGLITVRQMTVFTSLID